MEKLHPTDQNEEDTEDPYQPNDSWGKFLFKEYADRQHFYNALDASEKEMIRKELDRIEYFRGYFKDRPVSFSDETPLVERLLIARKEWRRHAHDCCKAALRICQSKPNEEKNCRILAQVQGWDVDVLPVIDSPLTESGTINRFTDRHDEPDYGYNGWLAVFENGRKGIEDPLCYGQFPHQKISIQELLYNTSKTPLTRKCNEDDLRYFHLPANNMKWVETAIARYYGEEKLSQDMHRVLNPRSKAERLLKHELWRGQQRGSPGAPVHSRQIGSRCSVVTSAPPDPVTVNERDKGHGPRDSNQDRPSEPKDIALFMPYLHWEIENRFLRMSNVVRIQQAKQKGTVGRNNVRFRSKFAELASNWRIKLQPPETVKKEVKEQWKPATKLGKYLWYAAKLFEGIDEAADEKLISDHLYTPSPLHVRRTLDQFYYWTIEDTTPQDQGQVVCHGTKSADDPEATARIVMVDQLWMWILDSNTILTSFPRRWGRNKPDPSAVHRGIRDHMGKLDGNEKRTVYDLALIIIDECSKVFFDRTKALDQRPEVVSIFGSAISDIAEMKTMAYERFGRDIRAMNAQSNPLEDAQELIRKSLNINFEWSVLIEAQHIIDELQIMQEIFTEQVTVLRDFEKALRDIGVEQSTLERASNIIRDAEMRREELAGLEKLQAKTRTQLRELLDMKQQQAGIIEAKAAIKRADEAVLQGRSIVVFTVFTIFFLPLSFFAAVFGMNARELQGDDSPMSLRSQFKYMFALASVVIFFSLAFAFSTWARTVLSVVFNLVYAYGTHWMGMHHVRVQRFYNTSELRKLERAKTFDLKQQALNQRLAAINSVYQEPPKDESLGGLSHRWTAKTGISSLRNRRTECNSVSV